MRSMRVETGAPQRPRKSVCDHHRTMPPASTTNSDRDIRFALTSVEWQQIRKQVSKAFQRLLHFAVGAEIFNNTAIMTRQTLQLRNEVWVRQVPDVKQ